MPLNDVALLSINGIGYVTRFVFTLVFVISVVYFIVRWLKEKQIERYAMYALFVCAVDGFVLNVLATTNGSGTFETRYHIMPVLFGFFLLGGLINDNWKLNNFLMRKTLAVFGLLFVIVLVGVTDAWLYKDTKSASTADGLMQINAYLEEHDVSTAVIYDEDFCVEGRKLRAYGKNVNYIILLPDYNISNTTWGGTDRYLDNADQNGKVAIIGSEDSYDELESYYKQNVESVEEVFGTKIWILSSSRFDLETGLVEGKDTLIDYPYSQGYATVNGEVQEDGTLVTNGDAGVALYGPCYQGVDGTWSFTLEYEVLSNQAKNDEAKFQISQNGELLQEKALNDGSSKCEIVLQVSSDMSNIEHHVTVPEGMKIKIKSITMNRQ